MIQLPGLIDPHVHLRTPGQEYKEDFLTGTSAALAGGFTTIIDMPNNLNPITTLERLEEKIKIAQEQVVSDIGFYFGSLGENFDQFPLVQDKVLGIKIYLNQTTGSFVVDETVFENICENWPIGKPILVHAEEDIIEAVIEIGHKTNQRLHIAHVSSQKELQTILYAKMKGYQLTCGVTPHHLFLDENKSQELGAFGKMKPSLKSSMDVTFLWQHLTDIDVIESDHAPHTREEKESENPPFGVPNLETTLPLLITAVHENKLTLNDIKRLCHDNPAKIFNIPEAPNTYIEVDENERWTIENGQLFTKCNWSPFNGWKVRGKVKKVVIRDTIAFENGKIRVTPSFGHII